MSLSRRFRKNAFPIKAGLALAFLGLASSCLTLNVNVKLPEAAVQSAADDYVRELYRAKEKGRNPDPAPSTGPSSSSFPGFSLGFASAWAADPVFKVSSPKALALREKLAAQVGEMLAQKRAGFIGETKGGLVTLRNADQLKPLLLKRIQKLVDDENVLRRELYEEVLQANGLGENRLAQIQESFGRSFQGESPSGTWLEDSTGRWSQKP